MDYHFNALRNPQQIIDNKLPESLPVIDIQNFPMIDSDHAKTLIDNMQNLLSQIPIFQPPIFIPPKSSNENISRNINEILGVKKEAASQTDKPEGNDRIPYDVTCYYTIPKKDL